MDFLWCQAPRCQGGPFTISRKNFVLIESDHGAKASAIIYSLVETAKANHLNTYKYLEMLLTVIPQHMDDKDTSFLDALLPWSSVVQQECLSGQKTIKPYLWRMSNPCRNAGIFVMWYSCQSAYPWYAHTFRYSCPQDLNIRFHYYTFIVKCLQSCHRLQTKSSFYLNRSKVPKT